MYTPQSGSYQNIDPNVQRILADTITMVNDVDQRLTLLRQGIAHAFPQLAQVALARPNVGAFGELGGPAGLMGGTIPPIQGVPAQFPGQAIPGAPFARTPFQQPTPFQTLPFLNMAIPPFQGAPTGFPLGAAGYPTPPLPGAFGAPVSPAFGQAYPGATAGVPATPFGAQPQTQWGLGAGAPSAGVVAPTFRGY